MCMCTTERKHECGKVFAAHSPVLTTWTLYQCVGAWWREILGFVYKFYFRLHNFMKSGPVWRAFDYSMINLTQYLGCLEMCGTSVVSFSDNFVRGLDWVCPDLQVASWCISTKRSLERSPSVVTARQSCLESRHHVQWKEPGWPSDSRLCPGHMAAPDATDVWEKGKNSTTISVLMPWVLTSKQLTTWKGNEFVMIWFFCHELK